MYLASSQTGDQPRPRNLAQACIQAHALSTPHTHYASTMPPQSHALRPRFYKIIKSSITAVELPGRGQVVSCLLLDSAASTRRAVLGRRGHHAQVVRLLIDLERRLGLALANFGGSGCDYRRLTT